MNSLPLELYKTAIIQSWNAIVITDVDRESGYPVVMANPAFCTMTGYSQNEILGKSLRILQGKKTDIEVINRLRDCLIKGIPFEGETFNYKKDGTPYIVHWCISPVYSDNEITHFISVQQDKTAFVESQNRTIFLADALNRSNDPIFIINSDFRIVFANEALTELSGYSHDELIQQHPIMLHAENNLVELYEQKIKSENKDNTKIIFLNKTKNGILYQAEHRISPIIDQHQNITHYVITSYDISNEIKEKQILLEAAFKDDLTGVNNRRSGDILLQSSFNDAIKKNKKLSLLNVDIDHFKIINDSFGHATGDNVLKNIASLMTNSVSDNDIVIRWGGEEFIIVLNDCNASQANIFAERIRSRVENHYRDEMHPITVSIGIATLKNETLIDELIDKADIAMYTAKRTGRNRVFVK